METKKKNMVNRSPSNQPKKVPVIAEPALANRPKRNISPKSWDNKSVLSWREEQELKKALYASLHPVKRQTSDPEDHNSVGKVSKIKDTRKGRVNAPEYKKTRSYYVEEVIQKPQSIETRHSSAHNQTVIGRKSEERELRSRSRNIEVNQHIKVETHLTSQIDETSKDGVKSTASPETKRKYRAQRKFAQVHGYGYGYTYSPSTTPIKRSTGSACKTPPIKIFPKRAKTEDFLTFLCLRGTDALPPHLDMYNFSREDSNGTETSNTTNLSNGRRPWSSVRDSSPSSSCTSVSQEEGFCPITPTKLLMTPIKKAARASAGTPEIARGRATRTRHTKNSLRTAFGKSLDITPKKVLPAEKRKSPCKLSPNNVSSKVAKSDRIRMKKKAVATLTTLEKRSRRKNMLKIDNAVSSCSKKESISRKSKKQLWAMGMPYERWHSKGSDMINIKQSLCSVQRPVQSTRRGMRDRSRYSCRSRRY